jgi:hypothetical protein
MINSGGEMSGKEKSFHSLKFDFPTLRAVFKEYHPWTSIILFLIGFINTYLLYSLGIRIEVIAIVVTIIIIYGLILRFYLLERSRRQWAEKKILEYMQRPSAESAVFHILEEILKSVLREGEYAVQKRPKEEQCIQYILREIIRIFCSSNYGRVVDCEGSI